ncbi:MAG TPA: hypothetical protein VGV87_27840 [Blastocatellia bacterium]|jgi:hypothetical protein|nr:hypothetical protein [Blastocatellia bacterium]
MRNRTKALLVVLVVAIAGVWPAQAQTKTNVSGTWKMNRAKSKFAEGGPEAITIKFEQQDASIHEWLTIGGTQGERTLEFTYKTDGSQNAAQVEGRDIKTMAKWEGDSLLVVLTEGNGGTFSRKFTMADGGKTMTIAVRQTGPNGDKDDTVLLEKQ